MLPIARLYVLPLELDLDTVAPLTELLSYTSEEKRAKLQRFLRKEDVLRGIWADLLVRKVIMADLHLVNSQIRFIHNEYGKPRLHGVADYHFNLSHSGKWVGCLVDSQPVGLDVEHIQPFDEAIARSFFAEEEYRFIREAPTHLGKQSRFYQVWSAKESYIKALGKGLSLKLDSFSVLSDDGVEGRKWIGGEAWQLRLCDIDKDYTIVACYKPDSAWQGTEKVEPRHIVQYLRSVNC
ncbi:4'-phosphopantetheinyl transferase superfamily protein [Paenibacillus sp. 5J-6]|uniref:4'-phosphopantetheinyl transferase superfamily protein n=1 Tax=Paenibacillus silvestris TaxID=2606219 RepID=A0A6L8V3A5_9BACL|nr:4'-phosphopantetheinyl transferase superfamily protein [Paenibacillus silvestris]MZQ84026.1 4'-phosphopantetheinyl transferase superfamily protein [Paenibacillus silvestris]